MLIVLGIIGVIMSYGIVAGIDSMARANFHAEADNAFSLLQKARSESINNIGGKTHGVKFNDPSDLILFGGVYSPSNYELKFAKNATAIYGGDVEINFEQLSGRASKPTGACPCTVTITDGVRNNTITINYEGGIDY